MTAKRGNSGTIDVKALLAKDNSHDGGGNAGSGDDGGAVGGEGERTAERLGYRAGYYMRDCQEFFARGHDDGKEKIITWLSRENFWTRTASSTN